MTRGPLSRFAVILFMAVLVSVAAGVLVRQLAPGFDTTGDAIWWAFLRARGDMALGVRHRAAAAGYAIQLNPRRKQPLQLTGGDELIVLTTFQ